MTTPILGFPEIEVGMWHRGKEAAFNELVAMLDAGLAGIFGDADLVAIAALAGTGIAVRTAADTWALRTLVQPVAGITITNPAGIAGDPTFALANDLAALEALGSTGIACRTAADTWAQRTLTAPAAGLTITNPAGIAGNPTFALANDLAALEGLAGTGIACRTAADTWAQRQVTQPAAGITVTNPAGVAGNITLALANDLAALEALAGTGLAARTAADTWAQRTITGTANQITVSQGDGVAGNPTLALANPLTTPGGLTVTGGVVLNTNLSSSAANLVMASNGTGEIFLRPQGLGVATGQLRITNAGIVLVDGGGIQFPATQIPSAGANTLDDYEEGTFTPAMTFGGAAVGMTFSTASGVFTKIGRLVWTQVTMQLSAKGSSTGAAVLTGWPFTNSVQSQTPTLFAGYSAWAGLTSAPFGTLTTTSVAMFDFAATGQSTIDDTNFTATSVWRATVTYGAS